MSQTLWGGSPYDSLGPQDWKLPTPPQPLQHKTAEEPKAQQMAFKEAMELGHSSSMTWEDQVQEEEEEQKRCSSIMEGSPSPGLLPPLLEGDNASNVSMVDDSLLQCDSDIVVEEEREENMETDAPLDSAAPVPLKEKAMLEDLEARDHEDHCSHMSEESTNQNPPPTLIPMKMSFWGHQLTFLFPGDIPMTITLVVSLGEDDLWITSGSHNLKVNSKDQQNTQVEVNGIGFTGTRIPSLA